MYILQLLNPVHKIQQNKDKIRSFGRKKGMELLFTEAQSYMETVPLTELEATANTSIAE